MVPQGPTRIGPRRHWKAAQTLRSIKIIMMAMMAYVYKKQTPIARHSMNTATSSGKKEVSKLCIHWVTILKSNICVYSFLFFFFSHCVILNVVKNLVHIKWMFSRSFVSLRMTRGWGLSINIRYYIIHCTTDGNQVGNFRSATNCFHDGYERQTS